MKKKYYRLYSILQEPSDSDISWKVDGTIDLNQILNEYVYKESENQDKPTQITTNISHQQKDSTGPRTITKIQTSCCGKSTQQNYGPKYLNMNKFIHLETILFFKKLQKCKELTAGQIQSIRKYEKDGTSFHAQLKFFNNNPKLKEKCLQFYECTEFVKKLLKQAMSMERKIGLIRKLEVMRKCIRGNKLQTRWKQLQS